MDSGPPTNTRTLDVTLRETIQRLERAEQTETVRKLLAEARHYATMLAAWTSAPPPPRQQDAVIDDVVDLLRRSLAVPLGSPDGDDAPEIRVEPGTDSPPDPPESLDGPTGRSTTLGRVPLRRQPATSPPGARAGPAEPQALVPSPGVEVLRPDRAPWKPVASRSGLALKRLDAGQPGTATSALVRLRAGGMLEGHRHGAPETLWVVAGTVVLGEVSIHAGELVRFAAGADSPPLYSLGESTLLLVGSDRGELQGPRSEPPSP